MLWPPRCWPTDASGVSTLTTRLSTVPFPQGPTGKGSGIKESCTGPARPGKSTQASAAVLPHQGLQPPSCSLSTTRAGKFASNINPALAISQTASRSTQLQSVILQAQLPLKLYSFQCYLACHPDRQWSQSLLQGICKGVDIGYQVKRKTVWSGNWKSAVDNGSVVNEYLTAEVALGRKAGPFNQLPFLTYVRLPMGIVIMKCSDSVKYCIIHDLSWPPGDSVNNHIDPDLICCIYASFDQAVSLIKKQGVGALMAKLDLADASKHILVHPEDWPLLCSFWDISLPDGSVCRQYYIDLFLPFSLCSSPAIFN